MEPVHFRPISADILEDWIFGLEVFKKGIGKNIQSTAPPRDKAAAQAISE
jgi:hypothetical protein